MVIFAEHQVGIAKKNVIFSVFNWKKSPDGLYFTFA